MRRLACALALVAATCLEFTPAAELDARSARERRIAGPRPKTAPRLPGSSAARTQR